MDFDIKQILRFKIAIQTIKDYWKVTLILTLLFSGMAAMYAGMYPAFEDIMKEMVNNESVESLGFIPGYQDMDTYVGFLNIEMYQIFWILILGIIIGFIAGSIISKEVESKTIDLLMSNPVSRKQIILEKFVGLIPMILVIDFVAMLTVMGATIAIGEDLNFLYLFYTHAISIFYFIAVVSIGLLISTIFDEKMKSSIITMAIIVAMFIFDSIAQMIPDYDYLGYVSLKNFYNPYETLKFGYVDISNQIVLISFSIIVLIAAMIYFEHKDIQL